MSMKLSFFKEKVFSYPFYFEEHPSSDSLAHLMYEEILRSTKRHTIVLLCIGTDRSTGDAFGPLVGTIIKENSGQRMHVYGTLESPVHALNLKETLEDIKNNHPHALLIAIDASMGRAENVGRVTFASGPLHPGSAVHKRLPEAGDMHMTGTVNVSGMMEHVTLQNTRLYFVLQMAEWAANALLTMDRLLHTHTIRPSRSVFTTETSQLLTSSTNQQ
ncbi:hypothetical protein DH09_09355 [Bacillaceae bacterium JMAK1]|nr:hypothetical protein DH09_09355 [Bacillaceae bacterium JMAK1]